ncbi:MAG: peptidylprolyl isomerase [Lachnospiraceae bacterium]|nr:peptidylprolyl isomerase [Lachnospiraceae bacterium]
MKNKLLAKIQEKEITGADLERIKEKFPVEKRVYFETLAGQKQLFEQKIAFSLFAIYAKECGKDKEQSFIDRMNDLKEQILTQIIMQELFAGVEVLEAEIVEFYQKHPEAFVLEETVNAKHILVDTKDKADKILAEINADEINFEDAAQKYSKCPSKEKGGELGFFKRGMMVKEFEAAAFTLPLHTYSEPIKSQFGYHIIEVVDKTEKGILSLEEVREKIKAQIVTEKQQTLYEKKLEELKIKYGYEILGDIENL